MIIYKYVLEHYAQLDLPEYSEVLTVNAQKDKICLWVKIPSEKELSSFSVLEKRTFKTFPTGVKFKDFYDEKYLAYIGTSFMEDGSVFHTFEERKW